MKQLYQTIIVGAGPGGLVAAAALLEQGISQIQVLEKGKIGQAWLDYPAETHLLSGSDPGHDDNEIAGVKTAAVFPNIPHPSHIMYGKYLEFVARSKNIPVQEHVEISKIEWQPDQHLFILTDTHQQQWQAHSVVWAVGMYATPNQDLDCQQCSIHYAAIPDLDKSVGDDVFVIGSGNGASGVVMQLAKPGRKVTLIAPHEYTIPEPIDCLWKENMQFIQELQHQGLVKIIENFRVKSITHENGQFHIQGTDGQVITASEKPIVCTGFEPTIGPVTDLVQTFEENHHHYLKLDTFHQSLTKPGLFAAGVLGVQPGDEPNIKCFREFGKPIAQGIKKFLEN